MEDQNKKRNITPTEWEVMRVIWAQGETTSKDVFTILNEKNDWKSTTVKTLLGRLVDKGMLSTRKVGNKFFYSPLVEQRKSVQYIADDLLSRICSTKVGNLIETIISESELSFQDISRLEEILIEKRKTAVSVVKCNCTPGQCQCHIVDEMSSQEDTTTCNCSSDQCSCHSEDELSTQVDTSTCNCSSEQCSCHSEDELSTQVDTSTCYSSQE